MIVTGGGAGALPSSVIAGMLSESSLQLLLAEPVNELLTNALGPAVVA